jgi:hypothetical protein
MVNAPTDQNTLTSEQMDRIVAIDAYGRDPEKAKKLAYLAHEVFRSQMAALPAAGQDYCLDCLNPLSVLTNPLGPNALVPPPLPAATPGARMVAAAEDAWKRVEDPGAKFREIGADLLFYGGLGVAGAALPGAAPEAVAVARVLYPPLKAAAVASVQEVSPKTPNLTADFSINWVAWTYEQVRENTEAGQAIGRHFPQLSDEDVHQDSSEKAPVVAAVTQLAALRAAAAAKSADEAAAEILEKQSKQYQLDEQISSKLEEVGNRVKALEQAAHPPPPPDVSGLRNAQGGFQLASYLLEVTGDSKGAQTAATFADAAGKVGDLIEKAASMAPMMLAAGYVGVAIAVFSALQSSKDGGPPYAAIFEQLRHISEQIESLRKDMLDALGKMDARLGNLLEHNTALSQDTLANVETALKRINEIQEMLEKILGRIAVESAAVNSLLLADEDARCIQVGGDRQFRAPPAGFITCRDIYVFRAANFSRSGASIAATAGPGLFPYAARYEAIRGALGIPLLDPVPNPDIWHDGAAKLLLLAEYVQGFLQEMDYDKGSGESRTIDPVIMVGRDILNFRYQLFSNWPDGGKPQFTSAHADRLFTAAIDERRKVAQEISAELNTAGLGLRVELGNNQPINHSFEFEFLRTGAVDYAHNIAPALQSVNHVQMTFSGGDHGDGYWYNQDQVDNLEKSPLSLLRRFYPWGIDHLSLRDRIGGSIHGFPARDLRLKSSSLDAFPRFLLLMEQAALGGKLIARITQFEIASLDMPNSSTANAVLNFAVRLFLQHQGVAENPIDPAGEYQGSFQVNFPSFNLIYDGETRGGLLVNSIWSAVVDRLGELKLTDASRNDPGIAIAKQAVDDFILKKQNDLMHTAVSADQAARVDQSRQDLLAVIRIGLNLELMTVDDLSRFLSSNGTLPSALAIVERMIRQGHGSAQILSDLESTKEGYQKRMEAVSKEEPFLPIPNLIEQRLSELVRLRAVRAGL